MKKISDFEQTAEVKLQANAIVESFKEELNALIAKYNGFAGLNESASMVSEGIKEVLKSEANNY